MNTQILNAKLELMATLNGGPDFNCTYEFIPLPEAADVTAAVEGYFSSLLDHRTQKPHPAEAWCLTLRDLGPAWGDVFAPALRKWCFEMPFSPGRGPGQSRSWEAVISNVMGDLQEQIRSIVGVARAFEVFSSPPCAYEGNMWRDFAFWNGERGWLLHLGASD
jgi:hypothetical protein